MSRAAAPAAKVPTKDAARPKAIFATQPELLREQLQGINGPAIAQRPRRAHVMLSPDEYRVMADESLRRAQEAQTEGERRLYFAMARTWIDEATRNDGSSLAHLPPASTL